MATEVIEVIETTVEVVEVLTQGPQGPQGPQGSAASVVYGTTAGTATQGNDARIANIGSGAINTATGVIQTQPETLEVYSLGRSGLADLKVYSVQLVDDQNTGYVGTLSMVSGLTADRGYYMPNATGTMALTQQATDYEVTDSTKGVIMKSPNGSRWRLTIDDSGSLIRTIITLIFLMSFICGSQAQVRDLVYGTNNVVVGPTNTNALSFTNSIAFSNAISFGTNAPTVRTNLGLGASWLTNSNSPATTNATNLTAGTLPDARLSTNVAILSNLPSWATTTNAATARTNLGVTVASNLPAPYSGAATTNSLLTADGSGSSAFVSTIPKLTISSGTITNTNPALSISQTWSNTNVAFTGLLVNITNTGSSNTSTLIDIQTNGTTLFGVSRDGVIGRFNASGTRSGISFNGQSANRVVISAADAVQVYIGSDDFGLGGATILRWDSSGGAPTGTGVGLALLRDGANHVLGQRVGTNPQTYNIYNTFSNSTNYERGKIAWTNNVLTIGTEKGSGGGTARALELQTDGTTRMSISATTGNTSISFGNSLIFTSVGRLVPTGTDGVMSLVDFANTGWNRLNFGGTTTNFPALKRTNTVLQVRLADDSAYTTLDAQLRAQGTAPTNSTAAGTAGDIRYDTNDFLYICVSSNTWRRTSLTNW